MRTAALTAGLREDAFAAMRASTEAGRELDVLVIGGGVTGAGIALDAVTRGLSTAVVEAQDWAGGTSSRSSKLVHGGLRFFERELVAADLDLPGDAYLLERMLRAGVRFAMLDGIAWDYFPSTLWKSSSASQITSQISSTVAGSSAE